MSAACSAAWRRLLSSVVAVAFVHSLVPSLTQDYVQAVLVASRPGLTASACSPQDASRLAAVRLGTYQAVLKVLGAPPLALPGSSSREGATGSGAAAAASSDPALTERQATDLVSVLDCELGTIGDAGDLSEVRG